MKQGAISVIIPAYNSKPYIVQAVRSALMQKELCEVIVVDDASIDHTGEYLLSQIQDKRLCYIAQKENRGVAFTRNIGVHAAQGKYIAFLDADDWWAEDKLKKQISLMEQTGCVLCYTARELYQENGSNLHRVIHAPPFMTYHKLLKQNHIACSSVVLLRKVAEEFPMEHDEVHEDFLTWLRILKKYQTACGIDEPLLKTRLTSNGKSRNKWNTFHMTYGVYRYLGFGVGKSVWYMGNHVIRSGMRYLF